MDLLRTEGVASVTTRRVADLAGLQAPAIYRLFGDKDGLLEAVAEHVLGDHVAAKGRRLDTAEEDDTDPVDDLRAGWRQQIDFGLENPGLFRLLSDPTRYASSPAAQSGRSLLAARVRRVALRGRLRVPETRALGLIQAAGIGVVTTLLAMPKAERDAGLADAALDAVLADILIDVDRGREEATASLVAVRAMAPELGGLTAAERAMLGEWLDRALAASARPSERATRG